MARTANGRRIYALSDYAVERTSKGWYFGRTSRFGDAHVMRGPYSTEHSVALMIARELLNEIVNRTGSPLSGELAFRCRPVYAFTNVAKFPCCGAVDDIRISGIGCTYSTGTWSFTNTAAAYPFTTTSYNGQTVSATTTGLWLTGSPLSLVASSTFATFASSTNASTTQFTVGTQWFTSLANSGLGIDANGKVYAAATSTLATIGGQLALTQLANQAANTVLANLTGGSAAPTAISTTTLFSGSAGQVLTFANGAWTGVGTTTFSNGSGIALSYTGNTWTIANTIGYPFITSATFATTTAATTTSISTQGVFFASSTAAASQFPFASSTALTAGTLCLSADCRTSWPTGGGGDPFTHVSYASQTTSATSSTLWLTGSTVSLAASSSILTFASSTAFTVSDSAYFATTGGSVGIGTTTPGSVFSIHNIANFQSGTSTIYDNLNVRGQLKVGTGSIYLNGAATSTFSAGMQAPLFSGSGASLTNLNASNLSSGTLGTARLGSGTANSSSYLRGDSTWATLPSSLTAAGNTNFIYGSCGVGAQAISGSGLYVSGSTAYLDWTSVGACAQNAVSYPSDVRLKTAVNELTDEAGLSAVLQLRPVSFQWKDAQRAASEGDQIGFIAQEVEALFPQVVHTGATTTITLADGTTETILNTRSLTYAMLAVPLVKAVQELNLKLEDLATSTPETSWQPESFISRFFAALKEKLIAWFADATNGITDFFAKVGHFDQADIGKLCTKKSDGTEVCASGDQLATLLASAGQSPASASPPSSGGSSYVPSTPPTPAATTSLETTDPATSSPAVIESIPPTIDTPPLAPELLPPAPDSPPIVSDQVAGQSDPNTSESIPVSQ